MKRTSVSSSCLKSIGYDETEKTLEVEFRDGRRYQYYAVPKSRYSGLLKASSHGIYYSHKIKEAGYDYDEVT